jgi:hypothetical protein
MHGVQRRIKEHNRKIEIFETNQLIVGLVGETVSDDVGIEPRTVATLELALASTRLDFIH